MQAVRAVETLRDLLQDKQSRGEAARGHAAAAAIGGTGDQQEAHQPFTEVHQQPQAARHVQLRAIPGKEREKRLEKVQNTRGKRGCALPFAAGSSKAVTQTEHGGQMVHTAQAVLQQELSLLYDCSKRHAERPGRQQLTLDFTELSVRNQIPLSWCDGLPLRLWAS